MPDVEEKTVDIDTSGPDVDIKLPEEKKPETEIEVQDEKESRLILLIFWSEISSGQTGLQRSEMEII